MWKNLKDERPRENADCLVRKYGEKKKVGTGTVREVDEWRCVYEASKKSGDGWEESVDGCEDGKFYDAYAYGKREVNVEEPGDWYWLEIPRIKTGEDTFTTVHNM